MFFRKKSKPKINQETLIVLAIVSLIAFLTVLAGNISDSRMSNGKNHQIGEIVKVKSGYKLVVDQATFNNDIAQKIHLPSDKKVLVVHLQVTNNSNKQLSYLPMVHSYLRNDRGDSYSFVPGLTDNTMPAGPIEPGQKAEGDLVFIVESEYMPLWFYFDSKYQNEGPQSFVIVK